MADRQKLSSKVTTNVKKPASSPTIRAGVDTENGDVSPIDKKRNKLGYHRTAVACGHCRRRKIRCIPSADTTSSRCQNCVRLKKDCQFFPVDQNATVQPKRTRSESKGDPLTAESDPSVSSSSPGIHAGISIDHWGGAVGTPTLSQGTENEYPPSYEPRQWYPPEQPQHPYWLHNEHNHTNSFAPSPYPMTPTTTGQPVTSQEHAYSYPAIAVEPGNYPYTTNRPRDGPLTSPAGGMPAFGGYRANTMPERLRMPDDSQGAHEMHPGGMNLPPQQIVGGQFPPILGSPSQYTTSAAHQVWLPAHSEPQHHPPNYIQPGAPQGWYGQPAGLHDIRSGDPLHSRSKPG